MDTHKSIRIKNMDTHKSIRKQLTFVRINLQNIILFNMQFMVQFMGVHDCSIIRLKLIFKRKCLCKDFPTGKTIGYKCKGNESMGVHYFLISSD